MSLSDEDENELRQIDADTEEYQDHIRESEHGRIRQLKPINPIYIVFFVIFFIVAFAYSFGMFDPLLTSHLTEKVIGKERISGFKGSSVYVIYTLDQQIFEVNDNFFVGATNAQNIYNEIQAEHTYNMTVIGWDIPILHVAGGGYPNVIQVQEVN
ncbi:MAG: hypothetical protein WCC86_03245 [Methanoregula sp.]